MSKSVGNVINPEQIIKGGPNLNKDPAYGIDTLRLAYLLSIFKYLYWQLLLHVIFNRHNL